MGDERHTQDFRGVVVNFLERFRHLDAASLAPAARMDLRLDDPYLAAEPARRRVRFGYGKARHALRRRHPVFAQDFLALILVNVHTCQPRIAIAYMPTASDKPMRVERRRDGV